MLRLCVEILTAGRADDLLNAMAFAMEHAVHFPSEMPPERHVFEADLAARNIADPRVSDMARFRESTEPVYGNLPIFSG